MANNSDFIKEELDHFGKIYTDLTYAISEISPFLDENELIKRKYYSKISILKTYIEKLNISKTKSQKKKLINFFSTNNSHEDLKIFKNDNRESFLQFENCSKCACLNCIRECEFKGCLGCRSNSYIKKCDKNKINIRKHKNFFLDLTNNNTGKSSKYNVLATLEDKQLDKLYIILENIEDNTDKYILYYYPSISSDEFGEITDTSEFDFIVNTFEQSDY
ncbi:DUF1292 domain-containing protein [Clostridium septicum]|uniref:DUF1292 domain-containing protein n=1 Tax=Clostridium septicum TaxID=1504 RepID=A0A9N7JLU1_CLOSE|nr:DUF1292 domain-containing protein [Clostridium septicum]AYE34803.1 DUF1292 domain-containing protein [Clostridium septicum]MDU1313381.1 DUF1292 domain-containing protein [Clostridium septicum]QAS60198.1 DUF1292 domain-containing protein [Clostridium septicum]UEC20549.1 DUF1292 domain-containing protein [Clostridium septicum]USS01397.1 DUF1292 domain-containing protein [Clostridium septicum]